MADVPPARVKRVLSNNAVLAMDPVGNEVVALGRGLGHSHRPGARLNPDNVEQLFFAGGDAASARMVQFLTEVPLVCVQAAAEIARLAHERLNTRISQSLILPLADHLFFAVRRNEQGISVQAPLQWEVRQLYPAEFAVGREAVTRARDIIGTPLADDEAVSIAMHLVNTQFATAGLNEAVRMTEKIGQILDSIERSFGVTLDPDSMTTARFVTHLRYLFARLADGKQIDEPHPTFVEAIANAHPAATAAATRVSMLIEMGLDQALTTDETAYLAMHIARLEHTVRTGA